jgi:hypothetical protein
MHVLPVLAIRIDRQGNRYQSSSSRPGYEGKTGGVTSVPVAVLPSGKLLLDSWDIAAFSGLEAIDEDLKTLLDTEIGPYARVLAYSYLLKPSNKKAFDCTFTNNRGYFFRLVWWLFLGNYLRNVIAKHFKTDDPVVVERTRMSLKAAVSRIDELLVAKKSVYLSGSDTMPGVADIAVASLMAIAVAAPGYADGAIDNAFRIMAEIDPAYPKELEYWQSTRTGQHVLSLYRQHRPSPA